jgi:hypothetical protein
MWFWRLANGCALLEHLTFMTFFNKLWVLRILLLIKFLFQKVNYNLIFVLGLYLLHDLHRLGLPYFAFSLHSDALYSSEFIHFFN